MSWSHASIGPNSTKFDHLNNPKSSFQAPREQSTIYRLFVICKSPSSLFLAYEGAFLQSSLVFLDFRVPHYTLELWSEYGEFTPLFRDSKHMDFCYFEKVAPSFSTFKKILDVHDLIVLLSLTFRCLSSPRLAMRLLTHL